MQRPAASSHSGEGDAARSNDTAEHAEKLAPSTPPVEHDRRFFDRQASELEYHYRVLQMATDADQPLLDRARFLGFFTLLTDEFFRVRVAGLKEQAAAGVSELSRGGNTPKEQIGSLQDRFRELTAFQRRMWDEDVGPALATEGIELATWSDLSSEQRKALTDTFEERIFPVLTPLAFGPAHPFPFISDLSLSVGVTLSSTDGGPGFARIKVPPLIDRLVEAPDDDRTLMVPVEEVIGAHLDRLFPGREIEGWHTFRVTRNADYDVEDVDVEDLLDAVASEILERRFGRVVRLELDDRVPDHIRSLLQRELDVSDDAVLTSPAPLDLSILGDLYDLDRPDLKRPAWQAVDPPELTDKDLFGRIRKQDVLVQHPYDSFASSTQRFIERAASDPRVLAIKQTLYRTSGDSPIVHALVRAAEEGKQVVALVELKARFDEEANIAWAGHLEEAGVHVVYGFVELKTHTKTALVVRNDEDGHLRRYGHIATGNYNPSTAKAYEDIGVFTADPDLTADLSELFNMLTGHSRQANFRRLLVAPAGLKQRILELIQEQAHPDGRIVIKVNNLSHNEVIEALYDASNAGAEIALLVRSICCLRPDVPGLSENIRVRSVVGPFLEHSRIFRFGHEPAEGAYLVGSADLMPRNLENRVEAVTPVDDPELRARLDEILDLSLRDEALSWTLASSGSWIRVPKQNGFNVQEELRRLARERVSR
ncbi:MAG: polyphosphate kinase 1 [Nitriliruptorales bacterium]|nr:polyphosphate kinase 1 [Nitriliruptorales bacterium]